MQVALLLKGLQMKYEYDKQIFTKILNAVISLFFEKKNQVTDFGIANEQQIKNWTSRTLPRMSEYKKFLDYLCSKIEERNKSLNITTDFFKGYIEDIISANTFLICFENEQSLIKYIRAILDCCYFKARKLQNGEKIDSQPIFSKSPNNKYIGVVAFDVDGTLIQKIRYSWSLLHKAIGNNFKDSIMLKDAFVNKIITYPQWVEHDLECLRKGELTQTKIIEAIKESDVTLTKNLHEAISCLKRLGYVTAIISGGADFLINYLLPDINELFDVVYINKMIFDKDGNLENIIPTKYDWDADKRGVLGKCSGLRQICSDYGVPIENSVFVGDDQNDMTAMAIAGKKILYLNDRTKREELDLPKGVTLITKDDLMEVVNTIVSKNTVEESFI